MQQNGDPALACTALVELSRFAASRFPAFDPDRYRSAASRRQFNTIAVHEKH
jgi:hypothetical protein